MIKENAIRSIPLKVDPSSGEFLEYLARYYFILPYCKGRVLDLGCGFGYGTKLVAKAKKKVITELRGMDFNKEAVELAHKYHYHPLLSFQLINPNNCLLDNKDLYNTIVSLELFSVIQNHKEFLTTIYHSLHPGGMLILSIPLKTKKKQPQKSHDHLFGLTEKEIYDLLYNDGLGIAFIQVEIYFQRGVVIEKNKQDNMAYPKAIVVARKDTAIL
ncbi:MULTISPECIES: class I SAM-dependent methyltransferase [Bacillaceae]|uniref:Class I SAM-dependent methyltransferase n=1 Tax=Evansella alkalicola TaxID=745819 RepID=A0ABS6JRZ4_9BACI|nr:MULTISPECIES: class I SAM-dependent methyltransferase [Bacillaceae]MBU9721337.1 class I SAM-dependent methyltransferase [Bacillus alkalicola]